MMAHLTHLKHIKQLEMVAGKGLQIDKVKLHPTDNGWSGSTWEQYDWFFYLVDGKFVLNHPYTLELKQVNEDLLATCIVDELSAKHLLDLVQCNARICSRLDDSNRSNQRLFMKSVDSAIIVKLDFEVVQSVNIDELPDQVMVTCEWLNEGKLHWVTNMSYAIFPKKETFNALKISDDTPAGNWHVKLYLRDECFASISFRVEENVYAMY
jgi:hypothetical protein